MAERLGPREAIAVSEQLSRIRHQYNVLSEAGIIACLEREKEIMKDEAKHTFLEFTIRTNYQNAIQQTFMHREPHDYLDGARYVPSAPDDEEGGHDPDLTVALWYDLNPRMEEKLQGSRRVDGNLLVFQVLPDNTIEAGSFEVKQGKRLDESCQKVVMTPDVWQENDPFKSRPAEIAIYGLLLPKEMEKE